MMVHDKDHTRLIDEAVDKVLYEEEPMKLNELVCRS